MFQYLEAAAPWKSPTRRGLPQRQYGSGASRVWMAADHHDVWRGHERVRHGRPEVGQHDRIRERTREVRPTPLS